MASKTKYKRIISPRLIASGDVRENISTRMNGIKKYIDEHYQPGQLFDKKFVIKVIDHINVELMNELNKIPILQDSTDVFATIDERGRMIKPSISNNEEKYMPEEDSMSECVKVEKEEKKIINKEEKKLEKDEYGFVKFEFPKSF